tara:strand:- start:31492 stop:32799 length:1308 start_codon:yes stop_codon:yes gene_type:complete
MVYISALHSREIIDSRGKPTVECEVTLNDGSHGVASVPSGASTGSSEATELRDNDPIRYSGAGVLRAVCNINTNLKELLCDGTEFNQSTLDQLMIKFDGTATKSNLGANAILAVSLAFAKAKSSSQAVPLYKYIANLLGNSTPNYLPVPQMNILNGGAHADNSVDFQEFMILPVGANSFREAVRAGCEIFHTLKGHLKEHQLNTGVGDEGGFAPQLETNESAISHVISAIEKAGYEVEKNISIGLDVASTEIFRKDKYHLFSENRILTRKQFCELLTDWSKRYPIMSIEDGMAESDWEGWKLLTNKLGNHIQLTGDDLFVTNPKIIQKGITKGVGNSVLIKPNQIGTLIETLEAIVLAKKAGYGITISHRSGETEDTTIADLAVAAGPCQIKTGSVCRAERTAKYNRLIRIEEELGESSIYAAYEAFPQLKSKVR